MSFHEMQSNDNKCHFMVANSIDDSVNIIEASDSVPLKVNLGEDNLTFE